MPEIGLRGVTKRFEETTAIDDVSMTVRDREYLCVVGPTGSGKSTLLRLIAGLVRADRGSILIDGHVVNDVPPERRNAALMPQNYALFPHMTAWQNVSYGPASRGLDPEFIETRTRRLFRVVKLQNWAKAYPDQLSGGMQQRVALIRCLAGGAKILLLDEPLGALDARLRLDLRRRLKGFARRFKLTVVHVTHDQAEAISLGDRVLLLRRGRVEQEGTPRRLYFNPRSIFAASFIGERVLLEGVTRETHEGLARIEVSGIGSVLAVAKGLARGDLAVLSVRRESLRFAGPSDRDMNRMKGVVRDIRPLGAYFRYSIELPRGNLVHAHVPSSVALESSVSQGSEVELCFSPRETLAYGYPMRGLALEVEAL